MGFCIAVYSPDPTQFDVRTVRAGDAEEMETRLRDLLAEAASPDALADFVLAGVGEGPEWEAAVVLAPSGTAGPVPAGRATSTFVAAVAGNREELFLRLNQKLAALDIENNDFFKLELAGGGDGTTYMALVLVEGGA